MELKDELNVFLDELKQDNILIIVEGKKDEHALKILGLQTILKLNKSLDAFVEGIQAQEVAILTDFDRRGKALYASLHEKCNRRGIKVNNRLRSFLKRNTPVSHVEGLATYIKNQNE